VCHYNIRAEFYAPLFIFLHHVSSYILQIQKSPASSCSHVLVVYLLLISVSGTVSEFQSVISGYLAEHGVVESLFELNYDHVLSLGGG
jgi:hypothetical protein